MTDPHDNAKKSGDVHPPDVESEPIREGMTDNVGAEDRGKATEPTQPGRPRRGVRKTGGLKDKDEETGESYSNSRESGKGSGAGKG